MQIVIDISDEDYKAICNHIKKIETKNGEGIKSWYNLPMRFESAIYHGISLPEHHGRLIDADAFAEKLHEVSKCHNYKELTMNVDDVFEAVIADLKGTALNGFENNPTIIEADAESEVEE